MGVAVAFGIVFGAPFAVGVAAASVRAPWYGKLGLAAMFPVAVALVIIAGQPYSLIDLGVGFVAAIAVFGWLLGFALSSDARGVLRFITRSLRRIIPA